MNVWIFVISSLFTPVIEPLGISMDEATSFVEPAPTFEPVDPLEPRYLGIERMFAQLEEGALPTGALEG
ncbi:hypothetical protein [Paraliomyxa miuraensis]|uniref:hypothetical protein n=1 Tax=Paraliomyxa miuraensis TaxID=376150 RepID=UPI00224DE12B|nr:hypothetical protein [Paraliomyxa miuraensis]MCX4244591.1 hypothetical protein [Paraliomyxa miuraensis]